jgi:nucleotide-binding universal stress UspA family protein
MTIRNVTVGIDGSPSSCALLKWADDLAARSGGRIHAVTSWHLPYLPASTDVVTMAPPMVEIEAETAKSLNQVIAAAPRRSRIEPSVVQGGAATALIDASAGDDLLVVGRRGVGSLRALGSTSRHCAIHASCPVAVVPEGAQNLGEVPAVVVAVDGSTRAIEALAWVFENLPGSAITAVNSEGKHDPPAEEVLNSTVAAAQKLADTDWPVSVVAVSGDPRSSVLEVAADSDLLVVGDRGHGGVAGLLVGSFAADVVGHAPPPLPVLVARSKAVDRVW